MSQTGTLRIKDVNTAMTGAFLVLTAIAGLYLAWPLRVSTDVGIGPGYVPQLLGIVQAALGGLLIRRSVTTEGEAPEPWRLRSPLFILAAVTFFAFTIERLGLVLSLAGLVAISCKANRETTLLEIAALVAGSVVFSVFVFVKALGLSLELWPSEIWGF